MYPLRDWNNTWKLARIGGISNENRTFLFRFLHNIHPTKDRLHRLNPRATPTPFCSFCEDQEKDDNWKHIMSECTQSTHAVGWLISVLKKFDQNVTIEKIMSFQLEPSNADTMLECIFIIAETLIFIWKKRQERKEFELEVMISKVRAKCDILQKSNKYGAHATNLKTMMEITDVNLIIRPAGVLPGAPLA